MIFPRMNLHCKLDSVQPQEHGKSDLLMLPFASVSKRILASRSPDFKITREIIP